MHGKDWVAVIVWCVIIYFLMMQTNMDDYHIGLIAVILPALYLIFGSTKGSHR